MQALLSSTQSSDNPFHVALTDAIDAENRYADPVTIQARLLHITRRWVLSMLGLIERLPGFAVVLGDRRLGHAMARVESRDLGEVAATSPSGRW
ncbi:MAG: hypothetical protein FJX25_17430 [Alphaproteobacteria bacterium]|nr:hypothetical protein [Alphaproteobacteria bacterium]